MRCFYADATPVCSNGTGSCLARGPAPASCVPQWQETDFVVNITARQPMPGLPRKALPAARKARARMPCFPLTTNGGRIGPKVKRTTGAYPAAPEDPFIGELKCVAVDRKRRSGRAQ